MKLSDLNLEGTPFSEFEQVDEDRKKEWDKRLAQIREEFSRNWPEYIEEMRRAKAKTYQLARTRVIG
jgi:hypothetical protein